ncbi:MAG: hypothetical protein AAGA58_12025 [Verrucomicrobiota bacterium]
MMNLEERFGISIQDSDAEKLVTPRDVVELIKRILDESGRSVPLQEIETAVKDMTIEQVGLKEKDFAFDRRFIQDMGFD